MNEKQNNIEVEKLEQVTNPLKRTCISALGEEQITPEDLQSMGQGIMKGRLDVDRDFS